MCEREARGGKVNRGLHGFLFGHRSHRKHSASLKTRRGKHISIMAGNTGVVDINLHHRLRLGIIFIKGIAVSQPVICQ
jgi:hypothetical protein